MQEVPYIRSNPHPDAALLRWSPLLQYRKVVLAHHQVCEYYRVTRGCMY